MSQNRRKKHWRWLLIGALLGSLSVGCGSSSSDAAASGSAGSGGAAGEGVNADGGVGGMEGGAPAVDVSAAGFDSNPVEMLFADAARSPWDFLATDAQDSQSYVDAALACYNAPEACDASSCEAFASCCVASGSCCEPVSDSAVPDSLDFESCDGQTVEACAAGEGYDADVFGPQSPVLTERGMIPNGTATVEGGALFGGVVNLSSERVLVDVQFSLPIGCAGVCLESAGVAFTQDSEQGLFLGAEVGLLLSGSREQVSLVIGGQVADSFDAGNDSTLWSFALSPSGTATVERDGNALGSYTFDAKSLSRARLAVYGRNLGTEASSAAVARVATQAELCDSPRGWTERAPMLVSFEGQPRPEFFGASEPSIALGPVTKVAFELDGQVFLGEQEAPGQTNLGSESPALFPTEPYEAGGVGDPDLVWAEDALYVFYTARDAEGVGSIGAAVALDDVFVSKSAGPVLDPEGDVVAYDAPTVTVRDGLWLMVARATLEDGATELRAFYTLDPMMAWERIVDGTLEELTRSEDPTSEITSPSLVIHNSAYQLYYARRSGTRWSIELAVSDELLIWRPMGEVLGASGEGFDSLGARSPDAVSRLGSVELLYSGQNAVSFQLGYALRPAPSGTAASVF